MLRRPRRVTEKIVGSFAVALIISHWMALRPVEHTSWLVWSVCDCVRERRIAHAGNTFVAIAKYGWDLR